MNKSKITLVFMLTLMLSMKMFAQDNNPEDINANISSFIPTSPEAASLGRYGMIPNNTATGQMNYSVPIYQIPLRSGAWNVSLNYNYSGMMLEGKPSMTGLGWSLLASGVINREVRGSKDEGLYGYYGIENKRSYILDYVNTGDMSLLARKKFKSSEWDSEADVYHVSVPGLSFSFKLDAADNPVFLSKNACRLSIVRSSYLIGSSYLIENIEITDTQGIVYNFEIKETTIPKINEEFIDNFTDMSWLLTNVTYPNGEFIRFTYTPNDFFSYDYSAVGAAIFSYDVNPVLLDKIYDDGTIERVIKRQILDKIYFSTGEIDFSYSESNGRLLYNSFTVKDNKGNIIDDYNLTYQGSRDLLVKIENKNEVYYDFEYYNKELIPGFLSSTMDEAKNKDRWGYYNYNGGAANEYAINIAGSIYQANLEPALLPTRSGALKRINYKTGGFTSITYEQNQIQTHNLPGSSYYTNLEFGKEIVVELVPDYLVTGAPNYKEKVITLTFAYPTVVEISHQITGTALNSHIVMEIEPVDQAGNSIVEPNFRKYYPSNISLPNFFQNYDVLMPQLRTAIEQYTNDDPDTKLNPLTPYVIPMLSEEYGPDDASQPDNIYKNSGGRLVLNPGNYRFKIYTTRNTQTNATAEIRVKIQKDYQLPPPSSTNTNVGGIRIAKLTDCTSAEGVCYERAFNYNNSDDLSTGALASTPMDEIITSNRGFLTGGDPFSYEIHHYSTENYSALNSSYGTPVYYETVREEQSGSVNNGNQVRNFTIPVDLNNTEYPKLPVGRDLSGALLASEIINKAGNNNDEPVSITTQGHRYFKPNMDDLPNYPLSLKVYNPLVKSFDFINYSYDLYPSDPEEIFLLKLFYPIITYEELDDEFKTEESIKYAIFEDKEVITGELIEYSNNNFIPNKITDVIGRELNLEGSYTWVTDKVKEITYPLDLQTPTEGEQGLISSNRINTPIKTETLKLDPLGASTLLFTKKIEYSDFDGNFLTSAIKSAKGSISSSNPLKTDITIHRYNDGNPEEVSKTDGIHVWYIWGYQKTKLIAKIDNMNFAKLSQLNISANITNLENLSNADIDPVSEQDLIDAAKSLQLILSTDAPETQMTAYTYDPGIGMTSQTDPNGIISYYEYDDFGRLVYIKDHEGNIVKTYAYNYQYH